MGSIKIISRCLVLRLPIKIGTNFNKKCALFPVDNLNVSSRHFLSSEYSSSRDLPDPIQPVSLPQSLREKKSEQSVPVSSNLAAYADRSPVLQSLIDLGVEIRKFDNNPTLCKFILKLNFERDVKPYLKFLEEEGVQKDYLGIFITKNPHILMCCIDDLRVRLNYLESKRFTKGMRAEIITKNPKWLSMAVRTVDERLGFLQSRLKLTGNEVRKIATEFPGVLNLKKDNLNLNLFTLIEEFGLDKVECKKLILNKPRLLKTENNDLLNTYHYLRDIMSIQSDLIIQQPEVLCTRVHILSIRHKFLSKLGRAQYNPKLPGYVSLMKLVCTNDEDFCANIALTSLETFYGFKRTL